jgi:hypothetical protein
VKSDRNVRRGRRKKRVDKKEIKTAKVERRGRNIIKSGALK